MTSQSESKKASTIVKCSNFDIEKLTLTDFLHNNERSAGQSVAFPRYNDKFFLCITNPIQLTNYGISPLGTYVQSDKDRSYIKIGNDENQQSCVELFNMLKNIDEKLSKMDNLPALENGEVWEYVSLIRDPKDDYSLSGTGQIKVLPKYCKLKLETAFADGNLTTKTFIKGKLQKVETVTELTNYLKYMCTAKYAINFNKLWVSPNAVNGVRKYGLTMKAVQIDITESPKKMAEEFNDYLF